MIYTERINGWQIRDPNYIPDYEPTEPSRRFDIVKWKTNVEGKEYCYSVGTLEYNKKEREFEFTSIGMRPFKEPFGYAFAQVIYAFAEFKKQEYEAIDELPF